MADLDARQAQVVDFALPSLGSDMDSATVIGWHVKAGDRVAKGDVLLDVDTEKAEIEVEVWYDATVVELVAQPGSEIAVGAVLARLERIGPKGEDLSTPPVGATIAEVGDDAGTQQAPLIRDRERVGGIDEVPTPRTVYWQMPPSKPGPHVAVAEHPAEQKNSVTDRQSRVRRAVGDLMSRANTEIPHYHLTREIDVSATTAWLEHENTRLGVSERLLPAAAMISAVAAAATRYPALNGHWVDGRFQAAEHVDLGIAVHLRGGGLMAPVIGDVANLSLHEVMTELSGLVGRVRAGRLRSTDSQPGSMTVTNVGDAGADQVLGVIHPPQVALIGIGRIRDAARVVDGVVLARKTVTVSLAGDHRATDGYVGSRFLAAMDTALQSPEEL